MLNVVIKKKELILALLFFAFIIFGSGYALYSFSSFSSLIIYFFSCFLIFLLISARKDPSHFSFLSFIFVPYAAINLFYVYVTSEIQFSFFLVFIIGMSVYFLIYTFFYQRPTFTSFEMRRGRFIFFLFFTSALFLILIKVWVYSSHFEMVAKAIGMIINNILVLFLLASFFALVSSSKKTILLPFFVILIYLLIISNLANDLSRLSLFEVMFLAILALYYRKYSQDINVGSYSFFFIGLISVLSLLFILISGVSAGGDALIFSNAQGLIQEVDNSGGFEPLMPIFNSGPILIPDMVWNSIGLVKPKAYNTSAWFLENVLGYDSSSYKWGVGVSAFGAGYLYGGLLGVIFLFFSLALLTAYISRLVSNPFFLGMSISFNIKMLFCIVRMDETFIFGTWLVSLPVFLIFVLLFRKKINACFYN